MLTAITALIGVTAITGILCYVQYRILKNMDEPTLRALAAAQTQHPYYY